MRCSPQAVEAGQTHWSPGQESHRSPQRPVWAVAAASGRSRRSPCWRAEQAGRNRQWNHLRRGHRSRRAGQADRSQLKGRYYRRGHRQVLERRRSRLRRRLRRGKNHRQRGRQRLSRSPGQFRSRWQEQHQTRSGPAGSKDPCDPVRNPSGEAPEGMKGSQSGPSSTEGAKGTHFERGSRVRRHGGDRLEPVVPRLRLGGLGRLVVARGLGPRRRGGSLSGHLSRSRSA